MSRARRISFLFSTRRRVAVSLAVAAAGIVAAAWLAFGYFGGQGLFIDDRVDEAAPFLTLGDASAAPAVTGAGASTTTAAPSSTAAGASGAAAPTTIAPVAPPTASGPRTTFTGSLVSRSHTTTGRAVVITDGTTTYLRLVDLATDNGPDVHVYLSAGVDARGPEGTLDDDFVTLGRLKGNIGSQNYEIPAGTDLDRHRTVVLWCKRFTVAFGAADLAPTPSS